MKKKLETQEDIYNDAAPRGKCNGMITLSDPQGLCQKFHRNVKLSYSAGMMQFDADVAKLINPIILYY